jgi:hypothetical protein
MDQPMTTPPRMKEDGDRWIVENARPLIMRIGIAFVAPIAIALVGYTIITDLHQARWGMIAIRVLFIAVVVLSAVFSLFGAESLAITDGQLVWRRGKSQTRHAALGDIEKLERQGNQLHVHVRGEKIPIVVGAGLRQQPAAMKWLMQRLDSAIIAARTGR